MPIHITGFRFVFFPSNSFVGFYFLFCQLHLFLFLFSLNILIPDKNIILVLKFSLFYLYPTSFFKFLVFAFVPSFLSCFFSSPNGFNSLTLSLFFCLRELRNFASSLHASLQHLCPHISYGTLLRLRNSVCVGGGGHRLLQRGEPRAGAVPVLWQRHLPAHPHQAARHQPHPDPHTRRHGQRNHGRQVTSICNQRPMTVKSGNSVISQWSLSPSCEA